MANAEAWNLGWQAGQNVAAHQRARKEMLADEDRQLRVTDLVKKRDAIASTIGSLQGDAQQKASTALSDIESSLQQIYHPDRNPGALEKDWHWLSGLIRKPKPTSAVLATSTQPGTPEVAISMSGAGGQPETAVLGPTEAYQTVSINRPALTPQQLRGMARQEQARTAAAQDVMAAGLSPEQQAGIGVRVQRMHDDAKFNDAARWAKQLGMSPEREEQFFEAVAGSILGVRTPAGAGKWDRVKAHVLGKPSDLLFNQGQYYHTDRTPLTDEEAKSVSIDPKAKSKSRLPRAIPSSQSETGFAYIFVDPSDPQNKSLWAWTPAPGDRYNQDIVSAGEQTDPLTGLVTKSLRRTGPATHPSFDLSGIGQRAADYTGEETAPQSPQNAPPVAPPPAAAAPVPSKTHTPTTTAATHLRAQAPPPPVAVTSPATPVGTYANPLPLDDAGHIPDSGKPANLTPEQWGAIKTAADRLLDGAQPKELGVPAKLGALAQGLAGKYGWSQGLFTPKDKLLIREAGSYLKSMREAPSLDALGSWASRQKMHNAIAAADGSGGFFTNQMALTLDLNPAEADFVQRFLQVRGTVSGLSQLTRGGRTTEAGIKRLQAELPDPLNVHSGADGRMRLDRLLSEIDVAQRQGFFADVDRGGSLVNKINKLLNEQGSAQNGQGLQVGGTIVSPDGTKTYRYKGGPKNDLKSYDEVPNAAPIR